MGPAWILFLSISVTSMLVSGLTIAAKNKIRLARRNEAHSAALYSLTKSMVVESEPERILAAIANHLIGTFQRPIVILLPSDGGLAVSFQSADLGFNGHQKDIAEWVFRHGDEAGLGTPWYPDSRIRYRPLKTGQRIVGVLGIQAGVNQGLLSREQRGLLDAFVDQAALAVTRADLAEKAQRTELLQRTDRLQKALLNSVSHDLRTPLVSVIGGLNTVLHDAVLLDASTQRTLLVTARDEAVRLNRLIQNLLDMTRLEGGAILAKTEPCDVYDVVGAALEQIWESAHDRPISVLIEPNLPLTPMDHALIVQVMVNLLDNALKYSPHDAPIVINATRRSDLLEIRVGSAGEEIPTPELDRVFDKFFRGTRAAGSRGLGLGLSICKGFVEAHNGRIWAEHRKEGGTEVAFSLPLAAERG